MISVCPRCSETSFKKLKILNVELDMCNNCRGIWMDGGEYEKVIEFAHNNHTIELENSSQLTTLREESFQPIRISCPNCGEALLESTPVYFDFIHHVVITDRCISCKGVWLDEHELSLILKYMKKEDIAISKIAKREIKKLEQDKEKKKFDEVLSDKKDIDRKTFFKILFGNLQEI